MDKGLGVGLASKEGLETFPSALKCCGSCSPVVENKLGGGNKQQNSFWTLKNKTAQCGTVIPERKDLQTRGAL